MRSRYLWLLMLGLATASVATLLWLYDNYPTTADESRAVAFASTAEQLARGAYLARLGSCAHCHTARGGAAYAGGRAIDTPFGPVYSSNITPDPRNGIGSWSADDFWQALHLGLSRDQRVLNPAFPYTSFTHITRADSDALFAYLQSLPASDRANTPAALRWPYGTQLALRFWRKFYFTPDRGGSAPDMPVRSAEWQRGAYLAQGLGHCFECHAGRNAMGAVHNDVGAEGGVLPVSHWYAPALGRASEASVAGWDLPAITRFLHTGATPQGFAQGPMAEVILHCTQYLQAQDAAAMAIYLQTPELFARDASPAADERLRPPAPTVASAQGHQLYNHHCADCHGAHGEGRPGIYPPLAGNRNVTLRHTENLIQTVLGGGFPPATEDNPRPFGMPPYMLLLNDTEVAQTLSYIRGAWNNRAGSVSEVDVDRLRHTLSR